MIKNKNEILGLAYEILSDLERVILPKIPLYRGGWRYKEMLQIISEVSADTIKLHPDVGGFYIICGDELTQEIENKIRDLSNMLKKAA